MIFRGWWTRLRGQTKEVPVPVFQVTRTYNNQWLILQLGAVVPTRCAELRMDLTEAAELRDRLAAEVHEMQRIAKANSTRSTT